MGGNQHIVRNAFHNLNGCTGEPPRDVKFAHAKWYARRRRVRYRRRRADHQRGLEWDPSLLTLAPMIAAMIARAEKNTGSGRALDMAAVVADVDQACFR